MRNAIGEPDGEEEQHQLATSCAPGAPIPPMLNDSGV
jgi:hypothetical protein